MFLIGGLINQFIYKIVLKKEFQNKVITISVPTHPIAAVVREYNAEYCDEPRKLEWNYYENLGNLGVLILLAYHLV
ncbi:hypothetical protein RhiirA4_472453 [Rhizophagus irregularis]|uniref:Uncharacterized protein n=1 Tax=Rhizophagus irregularis TaxID=588596 RepID=A0A2I1H516_9GLOM|nr:hypothetical protein RhiirA4_472453 [Rhizophagus irregularis]